LTIPFPLIASLQDYNNQLDNHFLYYGRWWREYISGVWL
jgi:hypothetical protein